MIQIEHSFKIIVKAYQASEYTKVRKKSKIKSSTTPDPGYHMGK